MFAKQAWFHQRNAQCLGRPVCWQGWAYWIIGLAIAAAPAVGLAMLRLYPEAAIWLLITLAFLAWDLRHAEYSRDSPADEVLYIGEEGVAEQLRTENYDLRLRR